MKAPEGYDGPELTVVTRNIKTEPVGPFVTRLMEEHVPKDVQKVAIFQKDKADGELTEIVLQQFDLRNAQMIDMGDFVK